MARAHGWLERPPKRSAQGLADFPWQGQDWKLWPLCLYTLFIHLHTSHNQPCNHLNIPTLTYTPRSPPNAKRELGQCITLLAIRSLPCITCACEPLLAPPHCIYIFQAINSTDSYIALHIKMQKHVYCSNSVNFSPNFSAVTKKVYQAILEVTIPQRSNQ